MIEYVTGDATDPQPREGAIVHVCNDQGGWGAGFTGALSRRWPQPEAAYRRMAERRPGEIMVIPVAPRLCVVNLIGQHGIGGPAPVRYAWISMGLRTLARSGTESIVHMPRIGCGLAGGRWDVVELIIRAELPDHRVKVYDLPC